MRNMLKQFIVKSGLYGGLFWGIVFCFAVINCKNLIAYWAYDQMSYNEWTAETGNKIETDYISNFAGKVQFVNFNGAIRRLLHQHEMNGVVKLNNGYLLTTMGYASDEELTKKADAVLGLKHYLEKEGIPLVFAMTPYTSSKYDPQLPTGIEDYGNDNMDRFLSMLQARNINVLDLRQMMFEDGINQYDMMYRTDHHWTTEGGFYAYTKIAENLEGILGCEIDEQVKDINNYKIETYSKWHLGSRGQRTGSMFAGIDDFDLITPKFQTSINNWYMTGDFETMLIDRQPLEIREKESRYTYDHVLNNALGNYTNNRSLNDKKILIMTDSMGKAVNPYMILSFKEIKTLSNYDAAGISKEVISSYKPDAVVLLYYPQFLSNEGVFEDGFNFGYTLSDQETLEDYLKLLADANYDIIIEVNDSESLQSREYEGLFCDIGIDDRKISESTDFITILGGGKKVEYLEDFKTTGSKCITSIGEISLFADEEGAYAVYLDGEECYVVEKGAEKEADLRICVMDRSTKKMVDYINFSNKQTAQSLKARGLWRP